MPTKLHRFKLLVTVIALGGLTLAGYYGYRALVQSYKLRQQLAPNTPANQPSDIQVLQALQAGTLKSVCKRETTIPKFSFKPRIPRELYEITSEVAMYHADRYLNLNLVPPTTIKQHPLTNPQQQAAIISSCTKWIDALPIKITSSAELQSLVSEAEYAHMNIFYFLFGQYDRHFNNLLIGRTDHKLYLIDNEAISRVYQYVADYSPDKATSSAWVPWTPRKPSIEIPNEPDNLAAVIKTHQDPAWIEQEFGAWVDIYTKDDMRCSATRIWQQTLWRQLYVCDDKFAAPFSPVIDPELLAKIRTLSPEILASFWPALPFSATKTEQEIYRQFIEIFIIKTLARKQMILNYFQAHPAGVRSLSTTRD